MQRFLTATNIFAFFQSAERSEHLRVVYNHDLRLLMEISNALRNTTVICQQSQRIVNFVSKKEMPNLTSKQYGQMTLEHFTIK